MDIQQLEGGTRLVEKAISEMRRQGIDTRGVISVMTIQLGTEIFCGSADQPWRTEVLLQVVKSLTRLVMGDAAKEERPDA